VAHILEFLRTHKRRVVWTVVIAVILFAPIIPIMWNSSPSCTIDTPEEECQGRTGMYFTSLFILLISALVSAVSGLTGP